MIVDFLVLLIKNKDNVTFGFLYCFFLFYRFFQDFEIYYK